MDPSWEGLLLRDDQSVRSYGSGLGGVWESWLWRIYPLDLEGISHHEYLWGG